MSHVAFIGLGPMGRGMAANLQRKAAEQNDVLNVFNRTTSKAEEFAAKHCCKACSTLQELRTTCSIFSMMVADDTACTGILDQLCDAAGAASQPGPLSGKVIINHSTVTPSFTEAAAAQVAAAGGTYIAAPVFGRPDAAAEARLLVVASGSPPALQQCLGYLEAYGRVLQLGDDAAKASTLKLCGNFMLFSMVDVLSEAFTLADKNGLQRSDLMEVINGFFPAPSIQGYARRIANEEFDASAGATVELALKDVRYVRQLADKAQMPLPIADVVFQHLQAAAANGHGKKDVGALVLAVLQAAGVQRQNQS